MKNIPISLTPKIFLQSLQSQVGSKEVAKNTTDILSFASRRHKAYRIRDVSLTIWSNLKGWLLTLRKAHHAVKGQVSNERSFIFNLSLQCKVFRIYFLMAYSIVTWILQTYMGHSKIIPQLSVDVRENHSVVLA